MVAGYGLGFTAAASTVIVIAISGEMEGAWGLLPGVVFFFVVDTCLVMASLYGVLAIGGGLFFLFRWSG